MSYAPNANEFYNLNIERAILSAILFDIEVFATVSKKITEKTFYLPFHQKVYLAIESLVNANSVVDETILAAKLKSDWDEVAMLDILAANPISNPKDYLQLLKAKENKRKIDALGHKSKILAQDENVSTDDAIEEIQQQLEAIRSDEWAIDVISSNNLDNKMPLFRLKDFMPIPQKALTLISADGGVGKSTTVTQMAVRFVLETNFKERVCLWLSEDPQPITKRNIKAAIAMLNVEHMEERIMSMIDIISKEPPALVVPNGFKSSKISNKFNIMKRTLRGYGLLVLDPFTDFFGGTENDADDVSAFFKPFKAWVAEEGNSIVFLHHANVNGKTRGSTGIRTAVRIAYELDFIRKGEMPDPDKLAYRQAKLTKDNWGGGANIQAYVGSTFEYQLFPITNAIDAMKEAFNAQSVIDFEYDLVDMPEMNI